MCSTMSKLSQKTLKSFSLQGSRNCLAFDEFVNWVLYDDQIGYYQSSKKRVGKTSQNDFYTSSSLGKIWGELIIDSCIKLLEEKKPTDFTFVEIGAEPDTSILEGLKHPFKDHQILRLGDQLNIPNNAVVFSNEWLDAQPFKRFKYSAKESRWKELFVMTKNSQLIMLEKNAQGLPASSFPETAPDGYLIDWPSGSIDSLNKLISQSRWCGVFLTFDYGLNKHTLLNDRPEGTARAYKNQLMSTDLLKSPGDQDLTCHLCWDSLEECLQLAGFKNIKLSRQESFLMSNATKQIRKLFDRGNQLLDHRMLALRELLHPAHLGHGMQALSAVRL